MTKPAITIDQIEMTDLILDTDVQKQVEASLATQSILDAQKQENQNQNKNQEPSQKTAEELAAEKATADAAAAEEAAKNAAANEEEEDENPISTMLLTALGVELEDTVDDTPEGINTILNKAIPKVVEMKVKEALGAHPMLSEFAEYVRNGGDPANFLTVKTPEVDYTKMELRNDDVSTQEKLVKTHFAKQGLSADKIDGLIKAYKDTNILFSQAEVALEVLATTQKAEQTNLLTNQAKLAEQQAKDAAETWKQIQAKVNEGKISDATIPMAERTAFMEYISKPVDKQGNTQADLDALQADLDMNLLFDYLRFKKLNLANLINGGVKTAQAQSKAEKLKLKEKTSGDQVRSQVSKNPVSALDGVTSPFDFQQVTT